MPMTECMRMMNGPMMGVMMLGAGLFLLLLVAVLLLTFVALVRHLRKSA